MTSITEFSMMVTVDMGRLMPVPRQAQRIDCLETTARMMPAHQYFTSHNLART